VPSNNAIDSAGQKVAEKIVEKSRAVSHPMKSSIYFSTLLNKIPEEVGWKKISGQMTVICIGNSHKETPRSLTPA